MIAQFKVTFGIVNCNRLYYLRSCLESLLHCTNDYDNKEIIIVDNASVESGTDEYLQYVNKYFGVKVFKRSYRDPSNEFAKALNTIVKESTGEIIVPLQGDMQFIARGKWLQKYVALVTSVPNVGCVTLDAQRRITNSQRRFFTLKDQPNFLIDSNRDPIAGAADCVYNRQVIEAIGPWSENNENHEGMKDSESEMLQRVKKLGLHRTYISVVPIVPVSVMIYTDARGTNARVRGNRRYGDYWPPKSDNYYLIREFEELQSKVTNPYMPLGLEDVTVPLDWSFQLPKDSHGNFIKKPINPATALPTDYIEL